MNFQGLKHIENPTFYLDVAFKRGKTKASRKRQESSKSERLAKSKRIELTRVAAVEGYLHSTLSEIVQKYPRYKEPPEFYQELMKVKIDDTWSSV